MFNTSSLSKVIGAFQKMERFRTKYIKAQSDAYLYLEEWANENNNLAIQDVCIELSQITNKLKRNLSENRENSFNSLIGMFKNFQEYDSNFKKKSKEFKGNESKITQLSKEIDASKSILFKTNMKKHSNELKTNHKAVKIFYQALDNLLDQIPDVSNELVPDICEIVYKTKQNTTKIGQEIRLKLDNLHKLQAELNSIKKSPEPKPQLYPSLKSYQSSPPAYFEVLTSKKLNFSPTAPDYKNIFF